ncbi:hypothetical protein Tco_0942043 [Tanacetum coccineum]|uniref:Uncharacterized protein n=1 Tax=Tanacetum coccineum TaxID=301880 RepID=A0ABQ5DVB6_9ASTR
MNYELLHLNEDRAGKPLRRENAKPLPRNEVRRGSGSSFDEQPDQPRRNQREDNRRWELRMGVSIPEFYGNTLNPKGFIEWLVAVEEAFELR